MIKECPKVVQKNRDGYSANNKPKPRPHVLARIYVVMLGDIDADASELEEAIVVTGNF